VGKADSLREESRSRIPSHPLASRVEGNLWDLIAIMHRYQLPMAQLQQFLTERNRHWFADPKMHWHRQVFGNRN
jgi:hypothetical protein